MARRALIHQIEARERRGRWFGALATLLSISLLLSGWVGLFAFLGANSAYGTFEGIRKEWVPDVRSMELTLPNLSRISRVYAASGQVLVELHDGRNSEPVPFDAVPEVLVYAILAAEDSDFFEHDGVDFSAIASAALDNLLSDQVRGGSTITQQVVKNAFVGNEISIQRKINEAFVSAEVERRFPKEQILEYYMNSVYFGAGAYGVKTATEEFFDKPMDQLAVHEAAALAVLVRNPSLYNPRTRPEQVLIRRGDVIAEMLEKGWITEAEAEEANAQPLGVIDTPPLRGPADHVVAEVTRQILHAPEFAFLGRTVEERKRAVYGCPADDVECEGGGGLQILTTIDLRLQQEANRILSEWLPLPPLEQNLAACAKIFPDFEEREAFYATYAETHSCMPTGAISMVDNHTGAIKVIASGLPFDFSQFDLAIQGRRNPGSSFKPFGLAAALEQGFTLGTHWNGEDGIEIECDHPCAPNGASVWTVRNATGSSTGAISLEEATYRSVNAVYAQVSQATGPENVVDIAKRMGVTESALDPVLSIVLGSSAVSPLEMASAYSNFATNGLHANDYLVQRVTSHTGEVLYEREPQLTQVADPGIFAAARRALRQVPSIGTASSAFRGFPYLDRIGGKTGTHQQYLDAWYVGFTPDYSTAVWVGYESEQIPLENVVIKGQTYRRIFGGTIPAPIWAQFMAIVMEGHPATQFPEEPANISQYLVPPPTDVPSVVGLTASQAKKTLLEARLNATTTEVASLEKKGIVVRQAPGPGSTVEQGSSITIYVSTGETPRASLPNLVGLTVDEAVAVITDFEEGSGVSIDLFSQKVGVTDPNQVDRIVAHNPGPGATITGSGSVILQVGELIPEDEGGEGGGGGGGGEGGGEGGGGGDGG